MTVRMLVRFPKEIEQKLGPFFHETQVCHSIFPIAEHKNCKLLIEIGIEYQARRAALDYLKLKIQQARHSQVEPFVLDEDILYFRNFVCGVKSNDLFFKR